MSQLTKITIRLLTLLPNIQVPNILSKTNIPSTQRQSWRDKFWKALSQRWHSQIINFFDRANEPVCWEKSDRMSNIYYQGYDPKTGRTFHSESETELLRWLEETSQFRRIGQS